MRDLHHRKHELSDALAETKSALASARNVKTTGRRLQLAGRVGKKAEKRMAHKKVDDSLSREVMERARAAISKAKGAQ